ncbi:thioredoxin family protein [Thermoleophilia bacterium SCSIO 60948]|nr:thioredoxin family protein [Thermoleophilia bacterium SCSIO 60948]
MSLRGVASAIVLALGLIGAACGGAEEPEDGVARAAPARSDFPRPSGSLIDFYSGLPKDDNFVLVPTQSFLPPGDQRFGFALYNVSGSQAIDEDVAIYAARGKGPILGPLPARTESLATDAPFVARSTGLDPDAAKGLYVVDARFGQPGEWRFIAVLGGEEPRVAGIRGIEITDDPPVPQVGERPPPINTPTVEDVGKIEEIETRVPADTMHEVDFADAIGEKPVALVIATPALCESRVCGPVVDIAEQVKQEWEGDAAFIHMEVWEDNNPAEGLRSQLRAFGLRTEPWLFVFDRDGRVSTRIEGAFSAEELEAALREAERTG